MGIQFRLLSTKGLDSKHGPLDNRPKECGTFEWYNVQANIADIVNHLQYAYIGGFPNILKQK